MEDSEGCQVEYWLKFLPELMNICLGPNHKGNVENMKNILLKYLLFASQHPAVLIWAKAYLLVNRAHVQRAMNSRADQHLLMNNTTRSLSGSKSHITILRDGLKIFQHFTDRKAEISKGDLSKITMSFVTNCNMTLGLLFFPLHQIFFFFKCHFWISISLLESLFAQGTKKKKKATTKK